MLNNYLLQDSSKCVLILPTLVSGVTEPSLT